MALVWENLSCDGQDSFVKNLLVACCGIKRNRKLLTELNGHLEFGELTALMGPSGGGKSTLLKCLTQGNNYHGVSGRIAVKSKNEMRTVFITQNEEDHLLRRLTVIASLYYASKIKNPFNTTNQEHTIIVTGLLEELCFVKAKNTLISKCSGGQKKRIAIGLELASIIKPNFLFLDEPTSGLDSRSGFDVIKCLRNLAVVRKIAVLAVIHQPSSEIFYQFHNLYILSKVGRCVFNGSPTYLNRFLINNKYLSTSRNTNPADVIISIASAVNEEEEQTSNVDVEAGSSISATTENDINEKMTKMFVEMWPKSVHANKGQEIQESGLCSYSAEFKLYSLLILLKRTCLTSLWRGKQLIFIRLALHAVVAIILASLYNRNIGVEGGCYITGTDNFNCSCVESEKRMRTETIPTQNVKFQFFSLLFLMFAALMPTVLTFSSEIKLFMNEYRNGWYCTTFYYISKTLVEKPCQLLFPFCYVYFLYWYSQQIGMDDWYGGIFGYMSWRYQYFLVVTIVSCFIAQGIGFLIGIMCINSFSMSVILSSSVLLFLFLFSGFFVKIIDMSTSMKFITNFSFIRFSFESLLIILYGQNRCEFLPGTNVPAKSSIMFIFNLNDEDLNVNLLCLMAHLIITRVLALILLKHCVDPRFIKVSFSGLGCNPIFHGIQWALKIIGKFIFLLVKCCAFIFVVQIILYVIFLIFSKIESKNFVN